MPRVVYLGYPARGHTTPSLPIVAELISRGVAVDYHSTRGFEPLIREAGARFIAYPVACEGLGAPLDTEEHLARNLAVTEELLPHVLSVLNPSPDLVMFDASALWGAIAARRLRLPCVASITTFALTRTMLQLIGAPAAAAWATPIIDRLNAAYGAGFRHPLDVMEPLADLKFVYTSRTFQPAGKFLDSSYLFLGPLVDGRPREGVSARGTGSRPLAYVSLGTIFNRDHALLRCIALTLAEGGWEVVVSLGSSGAAQPQGWPEHVRAHAFVDQIGVLAQAELFVTHGGMNSVCEALSNAVPMIIIPQAVDQHLVAGQAAKLGAAVVIKAEAVSAETLEAALHRIESNPDAFRRAARRLQAGFADVMAVGDAVDSALRLMDKESTDA